MIRSSRRTNESNRPRRKCGVDVLRDRAGRWD